MNNIKTIFFKEMRRVFTDKRMLLGLYLPGILIFVIYSIFGSTMSNISSSVIEKPVNQTIHIAYTDNSGSQLPRLVQGLEIALTEEESNNTIEKTTFASSDLETMKTDLLDQKIDLVIQFSTDFENRYNVPSQPGENYIALYYNAEVVNSSYLYSLANSIISGVYQNYLVNVVDGKPIQPNVAKGDVVLSKIMANIFPMVTVSLLFSTVLGICPESIAGEKERGTFSTILLTPVKRSEIVMGKILSLTIVGISSGLVSFLGVLLSLPKLMNNYGLENFGITVANGFALFFSIITLMLFFISFATLISTLCKSVKEATNYMGPCMLIFMMIAMGAMFLDTSNIGCSFIPVLNVVSYMSQLISDPGANLNLFFTFTILSNIVYTTIFVLVTAKVFTIEKVMITQ